MALPYLRAYIQERGVSDYNLRGYNKLETPHVKTITYGLQSYRYIVPHTWTTDNVSETLASSKRNIIHVIIFLKRFFFLNGNFKKLMLK